MSDRHREAHAAADQLAAELSLHRIAASIVGPETLGGRATGRVRLVLRAESARELTRVLAAATREPADA